MKITRNFFVFLAVIAFVVLALGFPFSNIARAQELTPTPQPTPTLAELTPVTAPLPTDALPSILDIATQFGALLGVAGLVAATVNVLKLTPIINDGDTGPWYAGSSLVGFGLLVYFKVFRGVDTSAIDAQSAQLSAILVFLTGYLVQLKAGQSWHDVLKLLKIPGISTSFTPETKNAVTTNYYSAVKPE